MTCNCYLPSLTTKGGYCLGTREQDPCNCGGDESLCDYYEDKREKAQQEVNASEPTALEFLQKKKQMCDTEGKFTSCGNCPIGLILREENKDFIDCDEYVENHPEESIRMVMNWENKHDPPITWNKWLHYLYKYYKGFSQDTCFLDWLSTPIPDNAKKLYNIPDKVEET